MFRKDWTTSSNIDNCSTLNDEHNRENPRIQLRNQETHTSDAHNQNRGGPIFNPVFA